MLVGKLGALVRRSKTFTLSSHLKGWSPSFKASNEQYSLLHSLRSSPCGNSPISRYSSLYGFKFMSKVQNLNVPSTKKMITSAAVLHSAKAEAANSGTKLLVVGPHHAQKSVLIWLCCCLLLVINLIQLGGVTRHTRSVLTMTDLKFTDEEWNHEFEKYMQSPGYKCVNSLSDFKYIHQSAYQHRMLGMELGIVFGLPFACFLAKGYITRPLGLRLCILFALGGAHVLFGCLPMVKSGLQESASEHVHARASPYRYAMHITSAFILYGGIAWTAFSVKEPEPPTGSLEWVRGAAKIRKFVLPACALAGITALFGAFVAGNGAGRAFPKTGDTWIPDGTFKMEPFYRNFFENASTVQLSHRILAATTLYSIASLCWTARKIELHPTIKRHIVGTLALAFLQVMLGISAINDHAPFIHGSLHHINALALMTSMICLAHCVRKPSPHVLKSLTSLPNIKS